MRFATVLCALWALEACSVHRFSNLKRGVVSTEWVPQNAISSSDEAKSNYSGPEHPKLLDWKDGSKADPEFHCIEPVTPASKLHGGSAKVSGQGGGATITVDGTYNESLGKIYDISDVVLLAQTQAFQACLARLSGDMSAEDYREELESIRTTATDLVRAQTAGAESTLLTQYAAMVEEEAWCREDVGYLTAEAEKDAKLAQCEVWSDAQAALLAALPSLGRTRGNVPKGGQCSADSECASDSCDLVNSVCL